MSPRLIKSEIIYRGRVITVRLDEVDLGREHPARWEIIDHAGGVVMLPLDNQNNIWFIRQYRHATGQSLLELPAGTLEPGEDPRQGAERELQEEIGMRAGRWEAIHQFWLAPGYSREYMYAFLARDLTPAPLEPDADEVISVVKIPQLRALELALAPDSELQDAKSILCLLATASRLGWSMPPISSPA